MRSIAFSPNGQTLATTGEDGTIRLWNAQGQPLSHFKGHQTAIRSINFSPDGQQLASAEAAGNVGLWNLQGKSLHKFTEHISPILSVAFSPDGKQLVSGCNVGLAEESWRVCHSRVLSLFQAIECKVMASKGSKPLHSLWKIGG